MERTDLMDTSEWAHREMVRHLRSLTPAQRLSMVIDRVETGRAMHQLAMKRVEEARKKKLGADN